jgi:hypothetical protein
MVKEVSAHPGAGWALFLCLGGRFASSSRYRRGLRILGFVYRLVPGCTLSVHRAPCLGCPFGLIQRGTKIKAVKKSATCAASPRKSSKLAPSLRSVAQTAKIFDRSDSAPVEPPISSRPVVAGSVGEAERPGTDVGPRRLLEWSGTNARALSPFSRGRRTGRGDGIAPFTWRYFLSTPLFLPSPGERLGRRSACFARKEGGPLSRDGWARVPSPEGEGQEEGTE